METKDLPRIEKLFHDALELDAVERVEYLARVCAGEADLRAEVESLVAAFEKRENFLEVPAFQAGLKALSADSVESLAGKRIGSYDVRRLLGRGGMGEVYLAEDTRLGRPVALKFLARHLAADNWARRQLIKEAQAVAMLDHPNICAVHGLEEADGHSFIVMQYIEGEALSEIIRANRLDPKEAVSLAIQIVSALGDAHAHGIIHRDIKPQNLMLTTGGQLKVLDFGLAKVIQSKLGVMGVERQSQASQSGLIMGTVAYMSPEQLCAKRLDFRSDLFSVGTVLYELASGKHPFAQETDAETIAAILDREPAELQSRLNGFTPKLERVISKCLRKDREERYESASALLLDLDNVRKGASVRAPGSSFIGVWAALIILLILSLAIGATYFYSGSAGGQTLAVAPLVIESSEADVRALGKELTASLIDRLSRVPKLRVTTSAITTGDWVQKAGLQAIRRGSNAETVLVGRLRRRGEAFSFQFNLIKTADGVRVWGEELRVKRENLELFQQELTIKIAFLLRLSLSEQGMMFLRALATSQSRNPDAYELYLRGRYYWSIRNKENILTAIDCFQQAIELDPTFARAHAGLADSYVLMTTVAFGMPMSTKEAMVKAKAAAKKALEIDDTLCEAHTSLGVFLLRYEWNWPEAEREFLRAISLNPDHAMAHFWYSQLLALTGRSDKSIAESETARTLEPFYPNLDINLARALHYAREYDRSAEHLLKTLEKSPNHLSALNVLGYVYQQQGRSKESIELFERLYAAEPLFGAAPLGYAYARAGRKEEALKILNELECRSDQSQASLHQEKAIIYLGLGDIDLMFKYLQKSCKDRFAVFPFLLIEPFLDEIRSDSRFAELLRCARLAS